MKSLKNITEGMFASDVHEGMFDVEDNAQIGDFNSEWHELWDSVPWKNANAKCYEAELNGNVLKIKKVSGRFHEPFMIYEEFEDFVGRRKIKTIEFISDDQVYLNSTGQLEWVTPITIKCTDLVICFGLEMRNVVFETKYINKSRFEGLNTCTLKSEAFYQESFRRKLKLDLKKVDSKYIQVEYMDFAHDFDQILGPAATTGEDWSRYLFDVKLPHRKGVFTNVTFQYNSPQNIYDEVVGILFKNPKSVQTDEIYINFYYNSKWLTLRVRKNTTEICKGEYGVGCKDGRLIFALQSNE